jgi:hypothetical protein
MNDRDLIDGLNDELGPLRFCGGESRDFEIALAFVRFVNALPDPRIHPDDVEENTQAKFETDPFWSALALEYAFSDSSSEDHTEIVLEFYATLTTEQRLRAWGSVRPQVENCGDLCETNSVRPLVDALAERLGISASEIIAEAKKPEYEDGENPPLIGWKPRQGEVSPEVAAWVKTIADDPVRYPILTSVCPSPSQFGISVLVRVEWVRDAPDAQPRRGVVLYEPTPF